MEHVQHIRASVDGRRYASYGQLCGSYLLADIELGIDHVQAAPYAPPSRIRNILHPDTASLRGAVCAD